MGALLAQLFDAVAQGLRAVAGVELVGSDAVAVRCGGGVGTCGGGLVRSGLAWLDATNLRVTWRFFEAPSDELAATLLACAIKATLLALPTLAAAQWGLRVAEAMRDIKAATGQAEPSAGTGAQAAAAAARRSADTAARLPVLQGRLCSSAAMLACTVRLLAFVLCYELNGVHSSLGGFLLVVLAGCLFESLLSTYELIGRLPKLAFGALFLLL